MAKKTINIDKLKTGEQVCLGDFVVFSKGYKYHTVTHEGMYSQGNWEVKDQTELVALFEELEEEGLAATKALKELGKRK